MKKIILALVLLAPAMTFADEPVKCSAMTSVLWQKYNLDRGDMYQVNNACKTGAQMKEDGISEQRFAVFVKKSITDNDELSRGLRGATEEAIVAGYDGIATP